MSDTVAKPKLIFTHDIDSKKESQVVDTYLEDTAKSISECKVAIDLYEDEDEGRNKLKERGSVKSVRFQKSEKETKSE